eukprot:m.6182 g.6182  ORF g.6182 m.6182 type:complete len:598 (+) comp15156_c0_seq2:43-1836(+)
MQAFVATARRLATSAVPKSKPKRHRIRTIVVGAIGLGVMYGCAKYALRKRRFSRSTVDPQKRKKLVVLGTGWGSTSLLQSLDPGTYDVTVISPRNYFLFTPLLPSVTVGTIEARSIAEPIRALTTRAQGRDCVTFHEAECIAVDPVCRTVTCQDTSGIVGAAGGKFDILYDVLVVAVGADTNTFNTPGVREHCYFVKETRDATLIRNTIMDSVETACMPQQTDEERRRLLHFVVVGGGPTGVEFAAELDDFFDEDLSRLYPKKVLDKVTVSLVQSADHILNAYDQDISAFTEKHFHRTGIDVITNSRVSKVSEQMLTIYNKKSKTSREVPYGMCIWATGVAPRPVTLQLIEAIPEQTNRRAIVTDEYLSARGAESTVYAIGDCQTIESKSMTKEVNNLSYCFLSILNSFQVGELFAAADVNGDGEVTVNEFNQLMAKFQNKYPQIALSFSHSWDENVEKLFEKADKDGSARLNLNEFHVALNEIDKQLKSLPATAQVASQQGKYLGKLLSQLSHEETTDPRAAGASPFKYKHLGSFAYVGGNQAALQIPIIGTVTGWWTMWLWRGAYANELSSVRTKFLVVLDWIKSATFGRDTSRL